MRRLLLLLLCSCSRPTAPCLDTTLVYGKPGEIQVWTINPCGKQLVKVTIDSVRIR